MKLAEELIILAYFLKIKTLEEQIICNQIMPMITAENAIKYLEFATIHIEYSQR